MRARWRDGETLDVSKEMMRVTLSIVGKTLFDTDVESKADEVGAAVTEVLESFWFNLLPAPTLLERLPIPSFAARTPRAAARRADLSDDRRAPRQRPPITATCCRC